MATQTCYAEDHVSFTQTYLDTTPFNAKYKIDVYDGRFPRTVDANGDEVIAEIPILVFTIHGLPSALVANKVAGNLLARGYTKATVTLTSA